MDETAFLKNLPAWQTLEEAKKQKLRLLEQAIQAKEASLGELAREVPANAGGGMVFGAGNESLDLEQQFTRIKGDIKTLQDDFARTIRIDTRVIKDRGGARHGSLVITRNLQVPGRWTQKVFRLVLGNEPETEAGAAIEHVELGSPLGIALLGITPGEEFRIGLGPDHVLAEVEDVLY